MHRVRLERGVRGQVPNHLHKVDTFSILKCCIKSDNVCVLQVGVYSNFPGHLDMSNTQCLLLSAVFHMHNQLCPSVKMP